jgi:hypothetical protein
MHRIFSPTTDVLITANKDTCKAATHWASTIRAGGGTLLLPVLDVLKSFDDLEAVYLLRYERHFGYHPHFGVIFVLFFAIVINCFSDGSPEESCGTVLRAVKELFGTKVKVI